MPTLTGGYGYANFAAGETTTKQEVSMSYKGKVNLEIIYCVP